jgi:hypothetical protein
VLSSVSRLPRTQALALLASAGRPLRPRAPGEAVDLSPEEVNTLAEAARALRLGPAAITAITARRFEDLSDSNIQALLALLTENMAAVALKDVDQRAVMDRVKLKAPDAATFGIDVPPAKRQFRSANWARSVFLAIGAVGYGMVAIVAVGRLQGKLAEQGKNLKLVEAQKRLADDRNAQLILQVADLQRQLDLLRSKIQSTAPPAIVSRLTCSGGQRAQGFLDKSGQLHLTIPTLQAGQQVVVEVTGTKSTGALEQLMDTIAAGEGGAPPQNKVVHTDFVSLQRISFKGPGIDLSCDATQGPAQR